MLSAVLAAAVWLGPPLEQPVTTELAVAWYAPSSCPQREVVVARIQALVPELGPLAEPEVPAAIRVVGRIDLADGDRWDVSLRFEGRLGVDERRFSGSDCVALADAAALVIAVAVDPLATSITLQRPAAEPEPEPELEREPEPEPEPEPRPELASITTTVADDSASDQPSNARFALAALAGGGYGPLELGHGSVGLELGVFGPWWRAGVRGRWLAPSTRTFEGGDTARFDGYAVGLRGCAVPFVRRLEFPVCAGVEAGGLRGQGTGTTPDPQDATLPWVAVVLGPSLRWALRDRFALALDLELLTPLVRGGFTIADSVAAELTPVGVQAFAGVELRLP